MLVNNEEFTRIHQYLAKHAEGKTLTEIATNTGMHRNSVAKYLEVLLTQGKVRVRNIGPAKVYHLAESLPISAIINYTKTALILTNNNGKIIQVNNPAKELLKKEVINQDITTLPFLSTGLLDKGKHEEYCTLVEHDKHAYQLRITPVQYESGEVGQGILLEDITKENEQVEKLKLFQRAIDASASGIVIADMRGKDQPLIYINTAFEKITGYDKQMMLGKNCRFLQGKDTSEQTKENIRNTIQEQREGTFQILNYKKDGTPFWNELTLAPVRNQKGEVTHYIGVQSDITHKKRQ